MKPYFKHLNEYYDKVYVLSVKSAEERRNLFAKRFEGLEYSFFFGADKNNFRMDELENENIYSKKLTQKHHRYSKSMIPGEVACSWSHRMIYEDSLMNNYERILIFEDDAVPDFGMLSQIPEILNEFPATGELLMWGWNKNSDPGLFTFLKQQVYHLQHGLGFLKWHHKIIRNLYARNYSARLKKAGFHDFTFAYAINSNAAKKLIQMQTPIQYIADNLLAYASSTNVLEAYIAYPAVFLHDAQSDGTPRSSYIR